MTTGHIAGLTVTAGGMAHMASALAFLVLVAMLLAGWRRGLLGAWLILASFATLLWAGFTAYDLQFTAGFHREAAVLEVLRPAGWIAFLLAYLFASWPASWPRQRRRLIFSLLAVSAAVLSGIAYGGARGLPSAVSGIDFATVALAGNLALAIVGLLLTENLFRNANRDQRWRIKFLCLGLAGMFAFDFVIYAEAMLFQRLNTDLHGARGLAFALIVPLIAISAARNRDWTVDVTVSRQVVFHSATLIGSGFYLLLMAGAGYYVRRYGGEWGPVIQATFLFGAILLLGVTVASGGFRARVRIFINKHFFSYKYDYRSEWLRVISTMSSPQMGLDLTERVIHAVADIMDSPEGELWQCQEGGDLTLSLAWNREAAGSAHRLAPNLIAFFEQHQWVVDLTAEAPLPDEFADIEIPEWLAAAPRAWLVIPLLHNQTLAALILLGKPRSPRPLTWEDFDLLKTVGRQAASYLAAQESARQLAESRQFEEFNRRFTFVVHDIKNLVSQLSLMLSNAGKFKDNPEFQDDMLETVRGSVEKMNQMLVRLSDGGRELAADRLAVADFIESLVAGNSRGNGRNLEFENRSTGLSAVTDGQKLSMVLNHLIDNALDAIAADGHVTVRLSDAGGEIVIEIEDDGVGMSPEFVKGDLFTPFRSTKQDGFGIGAYESRQIVGDLGGRLEVDSESGRGTVFRIRLPARGARNAAYGAVAE